MRRPLPPSRRALLRGGAALAGTSALLGAPRPARAASAADRKFVFVINYGGWDPLLVFAPLFGYTHVEMEQNAVLATAGGIDYVDHPERPSVRRFFQAWHERMLVLNGVLVPSVAHPPGQRAVFTGSPHEGTEGDWPTLLGAAAADRYVLPAVVLSGPSFPGPHAEVVCRTGANGQLDLLLSGDLAGTLDTPGEAPSRTVESLVERYLSGRAGQAEAAAALARDAELARAFAGSLERAQALKAGRDAVVWGETTTWEQQLERTVEILGSGIARCVTMRFQYWDWDTHYGNDTYQTDNYEGLFAGLHDLMSALDVAPGTTTATLGEETVLVVLSEMGRTPLHNGSGGRDHWPYTTALIVGPGVTGDRLVGGHDDNYNGLPLDFATGEVSSGGALVEPPNLGATLLALGGVDPGDALPGASIVEGLLT